MARIRSIKPELRRDLTAADWPRDCRYAWVLLWGYLDDHGRGLDDLRLLVADLFPLDRDVTERKLDGWLRKMAAPTVHGEPPLCRYEVDGRRYLHAPKWTSHQRVSHPQDSRYPACPAHDRSANGSGAAPERDANGSGTDRESFRPSRTPAEQGAGSREVEQGAGSRDARPRASGGSQTQTLLDTHLAALAGPQPAKTVEQIRRHIDDALAAGHPTGVVTTALAEWRSRPLAKPGLLPLLIGDAAKAHAAQRIADDPTADPDVAAWLADEQAKRAQAGAR